jgi:UDP-glucose 4-epimerase
MNDLVVLVTGGAGFIGSHLVEALLAQGRTVLALDDLSIGRRDNLAKVMDHPNLTFLFRDVRDAEFLADLLTSVNLVYHLAGMGQEASRKDPTEVVSVNVAGIGSVLRAALQHSCKVVYASCSDVYGKQSRQPIQEDAECRLGPPSDPAWAFASMKLMAEAACVSCAAQGLPVTILRLFDVYGPRDRSGLTGRLMALTQSELRGGLLSRSLFYVQDAVDALVLAGQIESPPGEVINIGLDRPASEPAAQSADLWIADITKAKRILGFAPRVTFEEGLALTAKASK